jgi:STE24 endopeptidase
MDLMISMALKALSRQDEYEADRFAATTTPDREEMIKALKKLTVHNLSNLSPHPFYVFLNDSHPPVLDRIRAIRGLSHQ